MRYVILCYPLILQQAYSKNWLRKYHKVTNGIAFLWIDRDTFPIVHL